MALLLPGASDFDRQHLDGIGCLTGFRANANNGALETLESCLSWLTQAQGEDKSGMQ